MIDYAWLNLGSLVLGIFAWFLPTINLLVQDKVKNKYWSILTIISMACCAIALYFQILYQSYLVKNHYWVTLLDMFEGLNLASSVLLGVTLILNIATIIKYKNIK